MFVLLAWTRYPAGIVCPQSGKWQGSWQDNSSSQCGRFCPCYAVQVYSVLISCCFLLCVHKRFVFCQIWVYNWYLLLSLQTGCLLIAANVSIIIWRLIKLCIKYERLRLTIFLNSEEIVESMMHSSVFVMDFEVFGTVIKHGHEGLIYAHNQSLK